MSLPLVSVICICFNHEAFVQQAISSVLNQTYKNIELIVINNASSDNSHEVITEIINLIPSIKFLETVNQAHQNAPIIYASGIIHAKPQVTTAAFLAARDFLLPKYRTRLHY